MEQPSAARGHGAGHPDPMAFGEREDGGGGGPAVAGLGAAKLRRLRALLQELNAVL
jgi:hypothetical protein